MLSDTNGRVNLGGLFCPYPPIQYRVCPDPVQNRVNNSLVLDKDFVTALKNKIPEFYQESEELGDDVVCWEFLKYKMRQFPMTYSKEKTFERKSTHLTLEKKN